MGRFSLRFGKLCLTPLIAASLLAGVSLDAAAYGSKGRIALQTGKTLSAFQFTYEVKSPGSDWANFTTEATQAILPGTKGCLLADMPDTSAAPVLARLNAFGPRGVDLTGTLGWVSTSIGVYDGPQGTDCGRVSWDKTEAIGLALGSGIPAPANAYDRLELDVEVKGNVELWLVVTFEDRTTTYRLLAGSGLVPAGTADPENKVLRPGDQTYKCSAATDGGADSGPRDNCRWIIEDLGTSFKIIPRSGDFSLEGGGDFDNVIANRTRIYLTEADGILDCGDTISADSSRISCAVTRLTNPGCTAVPYVFRASESETSCTLTSDMGDQQLVANLFVDYGAEPASTTTNLGGLQAWLPAALSQVVFSQDLPGDSHDIPPCLDSRFGITETILDPDGVVGPAADSGPEPFDALVVAIYDRLLLVPRIQFACAFLRQEIYENPLGGALDVRIKEGIQFWGDITFVRGQE